MEEIIFASRFRECLVDPDVGAEAEKERGQAASEACDNPVASPSLEGDGGICRRDVVSV